VVLHDDAIYKSTFTLLLLYFICRDIEKTVGPVQKIQRRGLSVKLTCTSMKQKEKVLVCSLWGNINAIASLLSYLHC